MKHASKLAAILLLGAVVAACGIGEGSTIEKLEILPISSATQLKSFELGDGYKLYQCLRDELIVRATFTDGTVTNFSSRANWSSSDPTIVEVSNGDVPVVFANGNPAADGSFWVHESLTYGRGTVIPHGTPGQTAVITAQFSSLRASLEVEIRKPVLRIVNVPNPDPGSAAPPYYLAQGTAQRLTVLLDAGGRTVTSGDFNGGVTNGVNINPFRWVFTGGTFVPQDDDVANDVDQWVIDAGGDRIAALQASGADATVLGKTADFTPHEVYAESYLCPADPDPTLRPVADIQVATFRNDDPATLEDDRLVLSRETGFHGSGFADEDIVVGSNTVLRLRGQVDANGDGSQIVEQVLSAVFLALPFNTTCEDDDTLLGCSANKSFSASGGLVTASSALEGDTARVQACFPSCLLPRASIAADDATVDIGVDVTFTATVDEPPAGVTVLYLFDFGDGSTQGPQAGDTASHAYTVAGQYTATVRLVDAAFPAEFLSRNAGAVRILAGVTPVAGNTAPTAALSIDRNAGDAPVAVVMSAAGSDDADTDDEVTVYEFDPGDGSPIVRQTSPIYVHTYRDGTAGPFTPTLKVYDESGVVSATDTVDDDADTDENESEVAVTGIAPAFIRSNVLDMRARKGRLCSTELQPTPAATPTEAAFTFPGLRFEALGSFVADTDAETCSDPVIGTQRITRFVDWTVRPEGDEDSISGFVNIRDTATDFQFAGQVTYFQDVTEPTTFDVVATALGAFAPVADDGQAAPTPTTLTITPCTTCTP